MKAVGVKDLENYQAGKAKLTATVAIRAKCAECTAKFVDGKFDCEVPKCPLYEWMPYKGLHEGK
jgi:hypothetical protein